MRVFLLKYCAFLIAGVIVFTLCGIGILLFLNNSYLKDAGTYSAVKLTGSSSSNAQPQNLQISEKADHFTCSHDGSYLAYTDNNVLKIADLNASKIINIPDVENMQIVLYKWIYDRDRLIITEKSKISNYAKMYYFELSDRKLVEVRDNYNNKDIKVTYSSSSNSVADIDFSAQTNLYFLKVTSSNDLSKLWKVNIMVSTNTLSAVTRNIGKILCLKLQDVLLYEDNENKRVYKYGSEVPIKIEGKTDFKLLSVDNNDNVYLALTSNNIQADAIYYGDAVKGKWNKIILNKTVDLKDLYMSFTGNLYANDTANSALTNLNTGKSVSYQGNLIGVYDSGCLTEKNNTILQMPIIP
jgi:hydroxymethylpyrimidine pyrophosphatase-like HAD family hydrolase